MEEELGVIIGEVLRFMKENGIEEVKFHTSDKKLVKVYRVGHDLVRLDYHIGE